MKLTRLHRTVAALLALSLLAPACMRFTGMHPTGDGSAGDHTAEALVLGDAPDRGASDGPSADLLPPGLVTNGLLLHLDAARGDGSAFAGAGCPASASTTWVDLVAPRSDGTLVATDAPPCAGAAGWAGDGSAASPHRLVLDGSKAHVALGAALGARRFTLEAWVRPTGAGVATTTGTGGLFLLPILGKGRAEDDGSNVDLNYTLGLTGDGVLGTDLEAMVDGQNYPLAGVSQVASGAWHHVAVSYDEVRRVLLLDGAVDASQALAVEARWDSVQHAALGSALDSKAAPAGFFQGEVAVARIYERALSPAELRHNCEVERGRFAGAACASGPGPAVAASSLLLLEDATICVGNWTRVTLRARDAAGRPLEQGGAKVTFSAAGGSSALTIGAVVDHGDGSYSTHLTGTAAGTPVGVSATLDSVAVPAPRPLTVSGSCAVAQSGLIFHLDAAKGTGNTFPGLGCPGAAPASWRELVSNAPLALSGFPSPPCASSSGWNGKGTTGDPYRLALDGADDRGIAGSGYHARRFTLEAWVRRTGAGVTTLTGENGLDVEPIVGKGRAETEDPAVDLNYILGFTAAGKVATDLEAAQGSQNYPLISTTTPTGSAWHHLVVTHDEQVRKILIDGAVDAAQPFTVEAAHADGNPVGVGTLLSSTGVPGGALRGELAVVRIYDRALGEAEVRGNCLAQAGRFGVTCAP